ncbi:MAG: NAD-dependent epimerase/dehydratase family protein [Gloeocapsa sp. DLM2.Bin57]|nr:MAG: NAD-dependent epimerase/dehydratase family protein [Gloeocapsa sp. DLM2.Bin57]
MNHLLITGATGFIGSHLLPILKEQDYQITATSRQEISLNQVKMVQIEDIDGLTDWSQPLQGVDVVIHLAARAHILKDTAEDVEAEFFRVNTQGTINLVKQAIEVGVKHFILVSSIGAMGTLSQEKLNERSPCYPDTPYGRSKKAAEEGLIELAKQSTMAWTILRPTLVYGQGNPGNMERLIKLVKSGLPLPLGGINNRRSFLYVGNLVEAIAVIINNPQAFGEIFLLSDGQDVSTPELISYIAKYLEQPCQLLPLPSTLLSSLGWLGTSLESWTGKTLPINQTVIERLIGSLAVDNQYIQSTLGWTFPYTLEQGLEKTLKR